MWRPEIKRKAGRGAGRKYLLAEKKRCRRTGRQKKGWSPQCVDMGGRRLVLRGNGSIKEGYRYNMSNSMADLHKMQVKCVSRT